MPAHQGRTSLYSVCPQNVESASLTRFDSLGLTKQNITSLGCMLKHLSNNYCIMCQVECWNLLVWELQWCMNVQSKPWLFLSLQQVGVAGDGLTVCQLPSEANECFKNTYSQHLGMKFPEKENRKGAGSYYQLWLMCCWGTSVRKKALLQHFCSKFAILFLAFLYCSVLLW